MLQEPIPGTIKAILNNQMSHPLCREPVLQVVSLRKKHNDADNSVRVRIVLSDGEQIIPSVLSSAMMPLVESEKVKANSLIKIDAFTTMSVKGKVLIIIKGIAEYRDLDRVVGTPAKMAETPREERPKPEHATKISAVNPFLGKVAVRARVMQKSELRKYSNARGSGCFFTMRLKDESGEIKATAFNDVAEIFFPVFECGKVYRIAQLTVQMANKQYSTLEHDYEVHFERGTSVELCLDAEPLQIEMRKPVPISSIHEYKEPGEIVDTVGYVVSAEETRQVLIRARNTETSKKNIVVADESGQCIGVAIWKEAIPGEEICEGDVVGLREFRVSSFGGKTLSSTGESKIVLNPEGSDQLKEFCSRNPPKIEKSASRRSGQEARKKIHDIKDVVGVYSTVSGHVVQIKSDSPYYISCPVCKKRLRVDDGGYYCEKCENNCDDGVYRYMLRIVFADATGQFWATLFDEQAEALMGISAKDLALLKEEDEEAYGAVFRKKLICCCILTVSAKLSTYKGEARVSYNAVACRPADPIEECRTLLSTLDTSN